MKNLYIATRQKKQLELDESYTQKQNNIFSLWE